jgi:hypothetical protein
VVDHNTHFQNLLNKFHALAIEDLPYNQRIIDALRIVPAAIMTNASLSEVCTHFRAHHARLLDPERLYEPGYQDAYNEEGLFGPKYQWCMVIDDEALKSFDADDDASVKLLSERYTTMEKPVALSAKYRDGTRGIQWKRWFKFSADMLKNVFEVAGEGGIEFSFRRKDEHFYICHIWCHKT